MVIILKQNHSYQGKTMKIIIYRFNVFEVAFSEK